MKKKFVWMSVLLMTLNVAAAQVPGPSKRIVGGGKVTEDEFPFVAKILYYGGSYTGCTGSLIAPDKVLTAGHCMEGRRAQDLQVGFGDMRSEGPRYRVASKMVPEEYSTQVNDIGILLLESAVPRIQAVPVRVLTLEEELRYAPSGGRDVVAVGWGHTIAKGGGDLPETMQKIEDIPVYTHEDCLRVLDDLRSQGKKPGAPSIHDRVLCAGEEGRAIGYGDSGGPLLVDTPQGWGLIGVLSQATHDGSITVIYMGNWTRTSYYLDWIFPTYTLNFAHSAVGDGWRTDLVLLNANRRMIEATIEIFRSDGMRRIDRTLGLLGESFTEWALPIGQKVESGGVVVSSPEPLTGFLRFRHENGAATSVQASPTADAFMVPVSSRVDRVGLAVYNADEEDLTVAIRLMDRSVYKTIPAQGKLARFVDELLPLVDTGSLIVRTDPAGGKIAVLVIELIEGSLVTLPAAPIDWPR